MELKRVVVTGLGALTPIGNTVTEYWDGLINGKSGAAPITHFNAEKFKTRFACEVKNFDITEFMNRKEARKLDKYAQYAMVAADEAIVDSKLDLETIDKSRVGVIWGAGIGGIETFHNEVRNFTEGDGTPRFNPFFIPKMIADIAPGNISIKHGFMGPNFTTVSACASSANAMIDALNYIRLGHCDVIVSTNNDGHVSASRPFDANRDGFVLGEGAGSLILEEYEYAKARGAKIYAEVVGGGLSSDAHHMTAPHPEGIGVTAVMNNCLKNAGLKPEDVDLINTHGTSTPLGDVAELKAIGKVFGDHAKTININSTKSMTGHLLGAAGAIEAISSILSLVHGIVPPTINHETVDENIDPELNLTLNKAQKRNSKIAMSNTFGFGGHNACVLFKKLDE